MALKTYPVELPDSAFSALRKTPDEFVQEMKYAAVIKWYEAEMITQDKAAEIAGLARYEFLQLLEQYKVSAIQYSAETLEEELNLLNNEDSH